MNLRQRAVGLIYVILSLANILTTAGMVTLLISLGSGRPLIVYRSHKDLLTLVQLICAAVITEWLDDFIGGLITGYRIAVSEGHVNYWIAPCKTTCSLLSGSTVLTEAIHIRSCCRSL